MNNRENIDFLLVANPEEFDLDGAIEAQLELSYAFDDINFQINDVPEYEFKGNNYKKWKTGACYKRGKISSAYKRFRNRVNRLLEELNSKKYLTIIKGLLDNDPTAVEEAKKLV